MIERYNSLFGNCKTINQVHQLHITQENRLTPLELYDLYESIKKEQSSLLFRLKMLFVNNQSKQIKQAGIVAMKKTFSLAEKSAKAKPEPFIRHHIHKNIQMYSSGTSPQQKTLVIAFAGKAMRLMMPIPCFLQHLSADKFDVLLFSDPNKHGFTRGIPGIANNIENLIEKTSHLFNRTSYKSVVSYGTSGGGLPAILAAVQLQLDKGISIGGNGPSSPKWKALETFNPDKNLTTNDNTTPNLLCVYGANAEKDKLNTHDLEYYIPIKALSIHSTNGQKVRHNPLKTILTQSKLSSFLHIALDPTITGYNHEKEAIEHSELWV